MASEAGSTKVSPSGWNCTVFTVPVGAVAVIVTGPDSAPGGIVSEWGPTRRAPPAGPMVWMVVAEGRGEHRRRLSLPPRLPRRLVVGAGPLTSSGTASLQLETAGEAPARRAITRRRGIFMDRPFPSFRAPVLVEYSVPPRGRPGERRCVRRIGEPRDGPGPAGRTGPPGPPG